jgi:protein TonB
MVITLPESSHSGKRPTSWTLASVAAHDIALSAWIANQSLPVATAAPREKPVFLAPRPADPVQRHPAPRTSSGSASGLPALPVVPVIEPPSINLPTISAAVGAPSFDASAYELRGTFAAGSDSPFGKLADAGKDFTEGMVDRRVEPRPGNPIPRYPPALSASGVNGSVTVRFVVDTAGSVDRGSVRVIYATHPLFEKAVLEALLRMRFVPAEIGKTKVRQLVELPFHFQMTR